MPISEKSYRDRQGKFQSLKDAASGCVPPYAPANASLTLINLGIFITGLDMANGLAETLSSNYMSNAGNRVDMVKAIRNTLTQSLSYVKSNPAWVIQFKAAKSAADKFRGVKSSTKTTPPPDGTPQATRNKGEQAYVELAAHLNTYINVLGTCLGYVPPSTTITVAAFNTLLTNFKALNTSISLLDTQLANARESRRRLYYEPGGAEEKFQDIKSAIKGQYGPNSVPWGVVKGMKW